MENDQDVNLETPNETVEETVETPDAETQPEVDVVKIQETNKKLYARLKATEAELKTMKSVPQVSPQPSNVEETVLLANGMDETLLGELKAVAKARGITSLIKAQADPIFVAVKEKFEKDLKTKAASVGASRGSGAVKAKKDFSSPGLSRDEHRAMVLGQ